MRNGLGSSRVKSDVQPMQLAIRATTVGPVPAGDAERLHGDAALAPGNAVGRDAQHQVQPHALAHDREEADACQLQHVDVAEAAARDAQQPVERLVHGRAPPARLPRGGLRARQGRHPALEAVVGLRDECPGHRVGQELEAHAVERGELERGYVVGLEYACQERVHPPALLLVAPDVHDLKPQPRESMTSTPPSAHARSSRRLAPAGAVCFPELGLKLWMFAAQRAQSGLVVRMHEGVQLVPHVPAQQLQRAHELHPLAAFPNLPVLHADVKRPQRARVQQRPPHLL
eukprot:CAMPEP_0206244628 /NCGR_PEP_ID=MMETSP0047_2-20121206/18262_1 /ASSEMBLY_ACC=CAM_ASM_000192 /TAXON_ID=195065 /ORGANISM="Chroomonas mesostigmatica_cf, Strain CCMP1168" /LENGTH=286 /DNA_ID=CAMNT_0053669867 /DNA_START=653 /DNA_END=1509 /DNA_ORIENTATION=+